MAIVIVKVWDQGLLVVFKVYGDPTGSKTLNMNDSGNMKHYETRLSYLCSFVGGGGGLPP